MAAARNLLFAILGGGVNIQAPDRNRASGPTLSASEHILSFGSRIAAAARRGPQARLQGAGDQRQVQLVSSYPPRTDSQRDLLSRIMAVAAARFDLIHLFDCEGVAA